MVGFVCVFTLSFVWYPHLQSHVSAVDYVVTYGETCNKVLLPSGRQHLYAAAIPVSGQLRCALCNGVPCAMVTL